MNPFGCFLRFARNVSIGAKILGIGVGIAVLFGVAILGVARAELSRKLVEDLSDSGQALARELSYQSADLISAGDLEGLHQLLAQAKEEHEHLLYAAVLDPSGRLVAQTFGRSIPEDLPDFGTIPPEENVANYLESEEETILDVRSPFSGETGGQVRIGLSGRGIEESLQRTMLVILGTLGGCSTVGILSAVLLTRAITRPIRKLVDTTERVGKGDLSVEAPVMSDDEIGILARSLNEMIERLRHYRDEVDRKEASRTRLLEKTITAQEDERKRVARELHDGAGQALTSILIRLRLLIDANPAGEICSSLEDLRQQVAETLEEIRTMALELRPSVLDDHGIVPALQKYVRDFTVRTGINTDFQAIGFDSVSDMPSHLKSALYRIAQEALTNVARHASADQASVVIQRAGGCIRLHVEDSGVGFDVNQALQREARAHHVGLLGMKERAALIDGTLTVESTEGSGTSLRFEAPWLEAGLIT